MARFEREDRERIERETLCEKATFSDSSEIRERQIRPDRFRTAFQRDCDRIVHCKAFRRLSHKTQVFLAPEGDHYRTRLTHTLEVEQISCSIARGLGLNADLTRAVALGHDLGHTPFGHAGEHALTLSIRAALGIRDEEPSDAGRFRHNLQSLRIVEVLENDGEGLNLTEAVRDGIACHTGPIKAKTLEGQVVALADRIAYVNHDIDDALRAHLIDEGDLPADTHALLGPNHSSRITTLVEDCIDASSQSDEICLSPWVGDALMELRLYLFENIYRNPKAKSEEPKARRLLAELFAYFVENPDRLPTDSIRIAKTCPNEHIGANPEITAATDFIAGMTDRYARDLYSSLFIPSSWQERG